MFIETVSEYWNSVSFLSESIQNYWAPKFHEFFVTLKMKLDENKDKIQTWEMIDSEGRKYSFLNALPSTKVLKSLALDFGAKLWDSRQ